MATKTFKIGLSNTDKQNMAQDVYERLLALTFPEYDTATSYEVGDFVVYNDQLYKCIGSTSGAWDSTKWELATLNDLLTDIESAVAFVNDKANVDGNYPTMTVGVADQLSPYDDESGDDQDEPFSFQATGTGNGSQPDFATGAIALMKEKQGNTVCVNQQVQNGNFANSDNWTVSTTGSMSVANNKATITWDGTQAQYYTNRLTQSNVFKTTNHKYLLSMTVTSSFATEVSIGIYITSSLTVKKSVSANTKTLVQGIIDATSVDTMWLQLDRELNATNGSTTIVENVFVIDLTQWFNGDIPPYLLAHPEDFFRYYQGSLAYNTGELVNANGRYIKCIGMNQWDEDWELGELNMSTGNNTSSSTNIRSKNYIKVIPNTIYYYKAPSGTAIGLCCYDANKNFVLSKYVNANQQFIIPTNCSYVRFYAAQSYGTTYNNDISINLYYEDEARCLTYEPYQVLTNNDTGTEVLRSAGSVKDYKEPDGTIHRLVGSYTFTGQENWTNSGQAYFLSGVSLGAKGSATNGTVANIVCPTLIATSANELYANGNTSSGITLNTTGNIWIGAIDYANISNLTGKTVYFELATPTTEQGTPFSENLVIDDFGSMDFQGANGVPQGNLIFYPVDYKAFIDTLYNYTDGTPSELAKKSDLPTAPQTWAESLPGYDATKTQTLKNVEGTLTWVDDE